MILKFGEDEEGNTVVQLDFEGLEYLMEGLNELYDSEVGTVLTTPAIWEKDGEPVVGVTKLIRVG